ncbi:helix-turn-helix domain-containing protein [Halobacillus salinus]|uniref:helix-turn-helix domain-containing protein n=1 Tax=Halobacillus salinus TaxID=192814 RepID=UPI0020CA9BDC|nr:helix-turn-helix domain-containing protein [Halobacillus salinus]
MIKQHRKLNNMTLEELADGICSVSYLSKIEHDSINASDEIYRLLEKRLNIRLVDINEEFDEGIFDDLINWYDAIQHSDFELMKEFDNKLSSLPEENQNVELNHLYKVIKVISELKIIDKPLGEETVQELNNIYNVGSKIFKFFYHKAIGVNHLLQNQFQEAVKHFLKNKDLLIHVPFEDSTTYFHLCLTYVRTRQCVESIYYGEKALEAFKKDLNYRRIVDTYMLIALNYRYLDAHEIAEEYYLKLLKIGKYHLQPLEQRRIFHNLGFIYSNQDKFELALKYFKKAEELETSETHFEISTIYMLAYTSYHLNNSSECLQYMKEGELKSEDTNNQFFIYKFFMLRNTINETTRDDDFIKKLQEEIIPGVKEAGEFEDYKNLLQFLGDVYYEKRMYKKASSFYKEANQFKFAPKNNLISN